MSPTPKPRRRWFQFRLRTLIVLTLLACIGMGWFGQKMHQARKQRLAVNSIRANGGQVGTWTKVFAPTFQGWKDPAVTVAYPVPPGAPPEPTYHESYYESYDYDNESRAHAWLRWLLGDDFFTHPTMALVTNAAGMEYLDGLTQLEYLEIRSHEITDDDLAYLRDFSSPCQLAISSNAITDEGLDHLTGLTEIKGLSLCGPHISERGVKKLREALPSCQLSYGDGVGPSRRID